jgi:hypothetical protein
MATATRSVDRGGFDVEKRTEEMGFEEVWTLLSLLLGRLSSSFFASKFRPRAFVRGKQRSRMVVNYQSVPPAIKTEGVASEA